MREGAREREREGEGEISPNSAPSPSCSLAVCGPDCAMREFSSLLYQLFLGAERATESLAVYVYFYAVHKRAEIHFVAEHYRLFNSSHAVLHRLLSSAQFEVNNSYQCLLRLWTVV